LKKLKSYLDARDVFCATGFLFLAAGLAWRYGADVALITVGAIILAKGLTRWV
jgi:phage shock protein PspC (stress-responsive transcriptional regulator)